MKSLHIWDPMSIAPALIQLLSPGSTALVAQSAHDVLEAGALTWIRMKAHTNERPTCSAELLCGDVRGLAGDLGLNALPHTLAASVRSFACSSRHRERVGAGQMQTVWWLLQSANAHALADSKGTNTSAGFPICNCFACAQVTHTCG